jgi:hypothetical protein
VSRVASGVPVPLSGELASQAMRRRGRLSFWVPYFRAFVAEQHRASQECIIRNNRPAVRMRVIGALRENGAKNRGILMESAAARRAAGKQHRPLLMWGHEPGISRFTACRSFRT